MRKNEILRAIERGEIERLDCAVEVEFDNRQHLPLGFKHRGQHYEVLEVLSVRRHLPQEYHYLVRAGRGAYNLVLLRQDPFPGISPSTWRLDYRVKDEHESAPADADAGSHAHIQMGPMGPGWALLTGELLAVATFHGHLCPELALGYRAVCVARARLGFRRDGNADQSVTMYASTSAADAVQYLTGCTVGNGRLSVQETGDMVFVFTNPSGQLLLKVLPGILEKTPEAASAEEKIAGGRASAHEVAQYQAAVDRLVQRILESSDDALFAQVLVRTAPRRKASRKG